MSEVKMTMSLPEYAKKYQPPRGPSCTVCTLPTEILKLLRKGRKGGISYPTMSNWLRKLHARKVSPHTIGDHFRTHEQIKGPTK